MLRRAVRLELLELVVLHEQVLRRGVRAGSERGRGSVTVRASCASAFGATTACSVPLMLPVVAHGCVQPETRRRRRGPAALLERAENCAGTKEGSQHIPRFVSEPKLHTLQCWQLLFCFHPAAPPMPGWFVGKGVGFGLGVGVGFGVGFGFGGAPLGNGLGGGGGVGVGLGLGWGWGVVRREERRGFVAAAPQLTPRRRAGVPRLWIPSRRSRRGQTGRSARATWRLPGTRLASHRCHT